MSRFGRNPYRNRQILKLRQEGLNGAQIAGRYGLSKARVCQILKAIGGPRPVGRPRLPDMTAEDAALYAKARRSFGAAYARDLMGIAA